MQKTMIVLTTGKSDRGTRATLAFSWACTALAMGQEVAVFLTMDGTIWASPGATRHVQVGGFEPLELYIEQFTLLEGTMYVCAPCSEYYCAVGESMESNKLLPLAELTGLATIVSKAGPNSQVITF